eukprot:scaffold149_cov383-Prasinococcus_capsulatus_cf.AAC.17
MPAAGARASPPWPARMRGRARCAPAASRRFCATMRSSLRASRPRAQRKLSCAPPATRTPAAWRAVPHTILRYAAACGPGLSSRTACHDSGPRSRAACIAPSSVATLGALAGPAAEGFARGKAGGRQRLSGVRLAHARDGAA